MKYVVKGTTMEIKLPRSIGYKGFSVECTYKPADQTDKYWLSMWLKRSDIDDKFKIDSQEIDTQLISGTKENIRSNICSIVEYACRSGFFTEYIQRFKYTYECFTKGNEILKSERLDDKD